MNSPPDLSNVYLYNVYSISSLLSSLFVLSFPGVLSSLLVNISSAKVLILFAADWKFDPSEL